MSNVFFPFQVPIYENVINIDSFSQIKKDVNLYLENNFQEFRDGWSSNTKTSFYLENNRFQSSILENVIKSHVENYYKSWNFKEQVHLKLNNYWINVAKQNSYQEDHDHLDLPPTPLNIFSGVLYINIPQDSGNLYLNNPISQYVNTPETSLLGDKHVIIPKEKLILLFPSWLKHSVGFNNNPTPRISISWNIQLNKYKI